MKYETLLHLNRNFQFIEDICRYPDNMIDFSFCSVIILL